MRAAEKSNAAFSIASVVPSITSVKRTGISSRSAKPRGMADPVRSAMIRLSWQPVSAATSSGRGSPAAIPFRARYTLSPNLAQWAVLAMRTGLAPRRFCAAFQATAVCGSMR